VNADEYHAVYDRIASDHVAHWRATGRNPFQERAVLKANEDASVKLIGTKGSILDVGCGMGDLLMRFPHRKRHGIDISDEYLAIARERELDVTHAEAEAIPFPDNSFDVVVAADILEHVFDLNRVALELKRVAKKLIVVRVPKEDEVAWNVEPYGFVHVRVFDEGSLRVLFGPILGCTVQECFEAGGSIHLSCSP